MAENLETTTVETENISVEGSTENENPSIEELMSQLAQERAEKEKLRLAKDKANSQAAKYRKDWESLASADDQEKNAINERVAAVEEENKQMKALLRMSDYSKRYMGIGMDEKTAESLSELTGELLDVDKFFSALDKFVKAKIKSAGEDAIQDLIKKNPEIKAGAGDDAKTSFAEERAVSIGKKTAGANEDILKHYRR